MMVAIIDKYLPKNSIRYRYFSGTFWMLLGTGLAQASTFIVTIIIARILGSESFGKYGIIQSTLGMFTIFAGLGMGLTNKRFVGELRDSDPVRCGRVIGFSIIVSWVSSIILALILFASAPILAKNVLNAPELVMLFRITSILLLLMGLNEAQFGTLSGLEQFNKISSITIFRAGLTIVLLIFAVWFWKLPGLIVGMTIIAFFVWVISGIILRISTKTANIKVTFKNLGKEISIFTKFTLPVIASGIIPVIVFWYAKALMVQSPNGYQQLGVYTASEQWLIILAFIPGQMTNVSQPILANIYANGSRSSFYKAVVGNIILPVAITLIISIGILLVAKWIPGLYGANFDDLSYIIVLMCFVGILRVLGGSFGVFLATINKMWLSFGINILWAGILIAWIHYFTVLGARGFAVSQIIAYGFQVLMCMGILGFFYFKSRNTI